MTRCLLELNISLSYISTLVCVLNQNILLLNCPICHAACVPGKPSSLTQSLMGPLSSNSDMDIQHVDLSTVTCQGVVPHLHRIFI